MRIATLALGITLLSATTAHAITCPGDSVPVGTICVDKYEASVWSVANPTTDNAPLVSKIKNGTVILTDLVGQTVEGVTQLGVNPSAGQPNCIDHEPFPSNFPPNGNWTPIVGTTPPPPGTPGVYAASVPGVLPSSCITWFQAQQACLLSDKRLPTNAEWQAAAAGTPDLADDGSTTCVTNSATLAGPDGTGDRGTCKSNWGTFDMVGNVWEWVADWVPHSTPSGCPGWGSFSNDKMCLMGASTTAQGPGTPIRGGDWDQGSEAGVFAVIGHNEPSDSFSTLGFRCAR